MNDIIDQLEEMLWDDMLEWDQRLGVRAAIEEIKRLRNLVRGVPPAGFDNYEAEE